MKRFNNIAFLAVFATLLASNGFAGSVNVPNSFQAGQKALAADVNGNFDALEAAVNDNDSKITANTGNISTNTANIEANSTAINLNASLINNMSSARPVLKNGTGEIVGFPASLPNNFGSDEPFLIIYSPKGYRTAVLLINGGLLDERSLVHYRSSDYTGTPLTPLPPPCVVSANNNIFYSSMGIISTKIPLNETISMLNSDGSCISYANNNPNTNYSEILPNDPDITGVTADMFTPPLSIAVE